MLYQFPGSGRSLTTGGGGRGGCGSGFSTAAPRGGGADRREEREAVAARRLAALGGKSGGGGAARSTGTDHNTSQFIAGASAPPVHGSGAEQSGGQRGGESAQLNLRALLDMGFPRDEARAALEATGNSLDAAISKLSS